MFIATSQNYLTLKNHSLIEEIIPYEGMIFKPKYDIIPP
jgi:hypothetical protein